MLSDRQGELIAAYVMGLLKDEADIREVEELLETSQEAREAKADFEEMERLMPEEE